MSADNPTPEQVAEALAWFRKNRAALKILDDSGLKVYRHAATLVRAALAADTTPTPALVALLVEAEALLAERLHGPGVDDLRRRILAAAEAAGPAGDATSETRTEYRACGDPPPGVLGLTGIGYVGGNLRSAQISARQLENYRFTDVRVESREVTTTRVETPWTEQT